MSKEKKNTHSKTTIVLLIVAVICIFVSTVGGARAALTYYSDVYASNVSLNYIGVTLVENGTEIASRDYQANQADGIWEERGGRLLGQMLDESQGTLVLGKPYREELAVKNSGTIDSYVRVTIYRYWIDDQGNKSREIDPELIDLHLVNLMGDETGEQCWIEDTTAKTKERTVLYYRQVLPYAQSDGQSSMTPLFADTITIHGDIASHVKTVQTDSNVIISTYEYNGYQFVLEAVVDSVQDHNATAAIQSAWGKEVLVDGKTLSLK